MASDLVTTAGWQTFGAEQALVLQPQVNVAQPGLGVFAPSQVQSPHDPLLKAAGADASDQRHHPSPLGRPCGFAFDQNYGLARFVKNRLRKAFFFEQLPHPVVKIKVHDVQVESAAQRFASARQVQQTPQHIGAHIGRGFLKTLPEVFVLYQLFQPLVLVANQAGLFEVRKIGLYVTGRVGDGKKLQDGDVCTGHVGIPINLGPTPLPIVQHLEPGFAQAERPLLVEQTEQGLSEGQAVGQIGEVG